MLRRFAQAAQVLRASLRQHSASAAVRVECGGAHSQLQVPSLTQVLASAAALKPSELAGRLLPWRQLSGGAASCACAAIRGLRLQLVQQRSYNSLPQWQILSKPKHPVVRWLKGISPDTALYGLIGANLLGYVLWQTHPHVMEQHAVLSLQHLRNGYVWTLFTHAFSHRNGWHLLGNMFGLYFFGQSVAYAYGGGFLLAYYLFAAAVSGAAQAAWSYHQLQDLVGRRKLHSREWKYAPAAIGASGAVTAIVILGCCTNPRAIVYVYGIIPVPSALFGALFVTADAVGLLGAEQRHAGPRIGYASHLGGAAVGVLSFIGLRRGLIRPSFWW